MNPENNGVICIVGYVTQSSAKHVIVQKALEDRSQASSSPEVTVKPDNSESLLANNESNPRKESISAESLSDVESDIPVIYSLEAMREVFRKCKQSTNESSAAKKRSKKIKTNAKLPEETSKPTRLHLLRDYDLATRIKHEKIKRISEKESIFAIPFFELCTILQVLQETDPLAQEICAKTTINIALPEGMEDLQPPEPKPSEAQNPDENPQQRARRWQIVDEIVCYGNQWYIFLGLLHRGTPPSASQQHMSRAFCTPQNFRPVAVEVLLAQDVSGYTRVCENLRRLQKDKIKASFPIWRAAITAYSEKAMARLDA